MSEMLLECPLTPSMTPFKKHSRDNIKVMVRVRPLNEREKTEELVHKCITMDEQEPDTVILECRPEPKKYKFDWIGNEGTTQEQVYIAAGHPLVDFCLQGYNCTIFAYGQVTPSPANDSPSNSSLSFLVSLSLDWSWKNPHDVWRGTREAELKS